MTIEEAYKLVEDVLKDFPKEYRKNYEDNKQDVIIKKENTVINKHFGKYNHDENIITIYNEESLPHELFHMAFRDRNRLNQELFNDDFVYDNGVIYYDVLKEQTNGAGLNEGFAEYLSRKCCSLKGHNLEYYFVNLLIQIYGEDILKYPLNNDSFKFYIDNRFNNIHGIRVALDILMTSETGIKLIAHFHELFLEKLKNNENVEETFKSMQQIKKNYIESIMNLFELIILEYINCSNPEISLDNFIELLNDFLINEDYQVAFEMALIDNYPLREKIEEVIKKIKLDYIKEKMK